MLNRHQFDDTFDALLFPPTSRYSRADTTAVKADPNVYSALACLAHPVSQSDCTLVLLFTPVLPSNRLTLANRRQNIDNLFLVNSYLPGCCFAKIASRWRRLLILFCAHGSGN